MEHSNENTANLRADFSLNDLAKKCGYNLRVDSLKIRLILEALLERYFSHLQSMLNTTPKHLEAEQSAFLKHKVELKYGAQSNATLQSTLKAIKQYNADFDATIYESLTQMPPKSLCKNAMDSWDKLFEAKIHAWQQQYITDYKSAFVTQISEWIELMQQFAKQLRALDKGGGLFGESIMQSLREAMEDSTPFRDLEDLKDLGDSNNLGDLQDSNDLGENDLNNVMDDLDDELSYIEKGIKQEQQLSDSQYSRDDDFRDINDEIGGFWENNQTKHNKEDSKNLNYSNKKFAGKNRGNLHRNIANLTHWLKILESDSVKKLCDMLGSLYKAEREMQFERFATQDSFNTAIPTPFAKEEISGVMLGRDLENVLPQELALLNDKDFSILFDLKFAENRLFCFKKSGYESEGERHKAQEKGAMILCVDTSGSMSGTPETIAKAIALFMAQRAMEANRKCYLINFSVGINTLDLSPPNGLFELMKFLQMSFSDGTDPLPALRAGLTKMRDEGYKNADLLMISDFEFDSRDLAEFKDLAEQKGDDNKCYALYIGDFVRNAQDSELFSREFYYNGYTHSIDELVKIKNIL